MSKRTRMSAVIDHSTMGLTLGTEMGILRTTHSALKKGLTAAAKHGLERYPNVDIELQPGSYEDNMVFLMFYQDKSKTNCVRYELKKNGKNYFINVSGNPTTLVAGVNDIPILIQGVEYKGFNAATITFKYLNRIMYAVLDELLKEFGFKWDGADKTRLVDGDISIQSYQVAWYSGDLEDKRDSIMLYLRSIYGGRDMTDRYVREVAQTLGLNARFFDNHEGNMTIEAKAGDKNRAFTLTFYAKDEHPQYTGSVKEQKRLSQLVRWDCTLNNSFLQNNKIKRVADLEAKYIEVCERDGYDIGFIRWVANKVQSRLKISYLMGLHSEAYDQMVEKMENVTGKNEMKVAKYWLSYDNVSARLLTNVEVASLVGLSESAFSIAKKAILEAIGLDIDIPRTTHDAILKNRREATMTPAERGTDVRNLDGRRSNQTVSRSEILSRDRKNAKTFTQLVKTDNIQGALRIRRFKPVKLKPKQFWIYNSPPIVRERS